MPILKSHPFKEIHRVFDDRFFPWVPSYIGSGTDLAVDVFEEKNNVLVRMNLPGVDLRDLEVLIEGNFLIVSGMRQEERETDTKEYYSKEIRRGSFSRSVSLPASVEAGKSTATCKDGILTVTMPVVAGSQKKAVKINVTSSSANK